ncbi:hypothetical protein DEIPH_ctg051orf0060 [Deinococcus phoenicis]|uniref:Uncharacterized protein n=1 Tax=Deinococcus phoenicis TaxID=1476583 RepID=A0A016QN10_9DEIO|nr:hypothetical protein [Deinococcus phoenicis]EYB67144.1 hypothetical protein DEIPH_ctg051orf0060 [Deinococcus phoenicis]
MSEALNAEALALVWAVYVGAVAWEEVVAWADGWILRLDAPPEELLELSLSVGKPNEAETLLRQLARMGKAGAAVPLLAQKLLDALRAEQIDGAFLHSIGELQHLSFSGVPDDVRLPQLPDEVLAALLDLWPPPWKSENSALRGEVAATLQGFL